MYNYILTKRCEELYYMIFYLFLIFYINSFISCNIIEAHILLSDNLMGKYNPCVNFPAMYMYSKNFSEIFIYLFVQEKKSLYGIYYGFYAYMLQFGLQRYNANTRFM